MDKNIAKAIIEAHENVTSIEPIFQDTYWLNKVKVLTNEERKVLCKFWEAFLGTSAIQDMKISADGGVIIEYKELVEL